MKADDPQLAELDAPQAGSGDAEVFDPRYDGPFDADEVDFSADTVTRVDLGTLVVTPWEGLGLQLQVDEATKLAQAVTAVWNDSALEVVLYAAPASGGFASELLQDTIAQAESAGGEATAGEGPFGAEVQVVIPRKGPKGDQLFSVSRTWFAEGPRWLLRATLLGQAALPGAAESAAAPFLEFFRNLVVRRGERPMVPGEVIGMQMPQEVN